MKIIPVTFYYTSFFLTFVIGLLQTKILTTVLTPNEYGELQLIIPLLGWDNLIGCLGTPQFIIRYYNRDKLNIYKESLFISTIGILVVSLVAYLFFYYFSSNYTSFIHSFHLGLLFLLAAFTQQIITLIKALLRVQERHVFYNAITISIKFLIVAGVICCILLLSKSPIEEYLLGLSIGSIVILFLLVWYFNMHYLYKWRKPSLLTVKKVFSYGLPIVSIMLMGDLLTNLNRYIIFMELDSASVAKYSIGSMIASLCFVVLYEPLNTILHPPVFKMWEENKKQKCRNIITRYINLYLIIGLIILGLAIRFEDILIYLIANMDYRLPAGGFAILLISNFLLGIYRFLSIHYYIEKNTRELGFLFFISIFVTLVTAWMLIKPLGIQGAIISILFGMAILTIMVWIRGQRNINLRLFYRYLIPSIIISLFFIISPVLSAWDIYSPLRWIDATVSLAIAAFSSYYLYKMFEKNNGSSFLRID